MDERRGDWIATYTGRKFYPLDPRPDDVSIVDIAWHLSHQCRYNGALNHFYSVAQHSYLVAMATPWPWRGVALLHDAAEAYTGDVASPLKRHLPLAGIRRAELLCGISIASRFNLPSLDKEARTLIEDIDLRIVLDETRSMSSHPELYRRGELANAERLGIDISPATQLESFALFMSAFTVLFPHETIE